MADNVVFLHGDVKSQVRRHAVITVAEGLHFMKPRRWWCPWRSRTPIDFIPLARHIVWRMEHEGLIEGLNE